MCWLAHRKDMPITEKLLKSYLQVAEAGDTALMTM